MKYIYYYYNSAGYLILDYSDDEGYHTSQSYLYYTLREAISLFRKRFNLQHKHIKVEKLF